MTTGRLIRQVRDTEVFVFELYSEGAPIEFEDGTSILLTAVATHGDASGATKIDAGVCAYEVGGNRVEYQPLDAEVDALGTCRAQLHGTFPDGEKFAWEPFEIVFRPNVASSVP